MFDYETTHENTYYESATNMAVSAVYDLLPFLSSYYTIKSYFNGLFKCHMEASPL